MIDLAESANSYSVRRLGARVNRIGSQLRVLEHYIEGDDEYEALPAAVNIEHEAREIARVLAQMIAGGAGEDV